MAAIPGRYRLISWHGSAPNWPRTDQPTVVFGHHPWWCGTPRSPSRPATRSTSTRRRHPWRLLGHAGNVPPPRRPHARSKRKSAAAVVQREIAPARRPWRFSLLRLHTGGYALNLQVRSDLAAAGASSRQEILVCGRSSRRSISAAPTSTWMRCARTSASWRRPAPTSSCAAILLRPAVVIRPIVSSP